MDQAQLAELNGPVRVPATPKPAGSHHHRFSKADHAALRAAVLERVRNRTLPTLKIPRYDPNRTPDADTFFDGLSQQSVL